MDRLLELRRKQGKLARRVARAGEGLQQLFLKEVIRKYDARSQFGGFVVGEILFSLTFRKYCDVHIGCRTNVNVSMNLYTGQVKIRQVEELLNKSVAIINNPEIKYAKSYVDVLNRGEPDSKEGQLMKLWHNAQVTR